MKKFEKGLKDPKGFTELKQRIDKYFGLSFEVKEAYLKDDCHAKLAARSPSGKIIIELEVNNYDRPGWRVGGIDDAITNYHWNALIDMYEKKESK